MADSEASTTIENTEVVTKYKAAAEVSNRVLKKVIDAAVEGARVLDLCTTGDREIENGLKNLHRKSAKGIGFPTCVSVNNVICHFSPLPSDDDASTTLKNGDMVKIQLGAQIDGYAAITATTIVVGANSEKPVTGRKADVLMAAHLAAEAALRLIKPGMGNMAVTDTIQKISRAFNTNSVEGMLSHQQEKDDIESKKQIILNPNEIQKRDFEPVTFEENEVYGVDVLISSGEGKPKPSTARTTVYRKTDITYQLKMRTSREVYSEITKKYGAFPFPLRSLSDEKKAKMAITECATHNLVTPYHVYQEKEDEHVSQFFFTVLLTKNGPDKITNTYFDPSIVKSDKKLEDEEIVKLISSPVNTKNKKTKKKKTDKGDKNNKDDTNVAQGEPAA